MSKPCLHAQAGREALNNKAENVCFVLVWIELVFISDGLHFMKYFKKKCFWHNFFLIGSFREVVIEHFLLVYITVIPFV